MVKARSSQSALWDRRIDSLFLTRLGIKPKDWIEEIAFKYHSTPEAVRRDWSNRKTWMKQLLKVEDAEMLALEILYDYDRALQEAYRLFGKTENVEGKIQALWLRLKAIKMRESYLKAVGALEHIKLDFADKADNHSNQLFEEKWPQFKGHRDREIRREAYWRALPPEEKIAMLREGLQRNGRK